MRSCFLIFMLIFLAACNPNQSAVKILTGGIFSPVLFQVDNLDAASGKIDLGEFVISTDPKTITVTVHNSTKFPYTSLDLLISGDGMNAPAITFVPTAEGEMNFPGLGGTCGRTLKSKETCEIKILFTPRDSRPYVEFLKLTFFNYVEVENHSVQIDILAGTPASLSFTNDKTQYTFGKLVGSANTPVIERTEAPKLSETLEIVNAGGLPAKELIITQLETCVSTLSNSCPAGMFGAYHLESFCPAKLMPGEKCTVRVDYAPKNQDPENGIVPEEIKEINYRNALSFVYVRDPTGEKGGLNASFRSVSTNIEAKFKVTSSTMIFETPIVSGNRESRAFRINNLGYRDGEIKALAIRDFSGSLIGTCKRKSASDILECKDSGGDVVDLSILPFSIRDRNNCLTLPTDTPVSVDVGLGCLFDMYFQPSITFTTDRLTEFQNHQVEVIADSRWKSSEHIVTSKIFNLSAKSLAPAKLELTKVRYDTTEYPFIGGNPWVANLGRLTLQSPNFYKPKSMTITFTNRGSVPATNLVITDGRNIAIPTNGTTTTLGNYFPKFYTSVSAPESTCTIVAPTDSCSITMRFAPVGLDTNLEEDANMFDATGEDLERYKSFKVHYKNGSNYTDDNLIGDVNAPEAKSEARLKAKMIRKGLLMQLNDDDRNVTPLAQGTALAGDINHTYIYIQNIGTGPVPYIRLQTPPLLTGSPSTQLISTPNPSSLGADFDCLTLVDQDQTFTTPANANPASRLGNFATLEKEKSCVYTVRMQSHPARKNVNPSACNNILPSTSIEEASRFFSREYQAAGGEGLWEYCSTNLELNWNANFTYYDGDATNPDLPPGAVYGQNFSLGTYTQTLRQNWSSKIVPHSPMPSLTSTIYREAYTLPTISATQTSKNIPEMWLYGLGFNFFTARNDPAQSSPLIQGDESRDVLPNLSSFGDKGNYDYIIYLGSFPQGSPSMDFPVNLLNTGNYLARVSSLTASGDASYSTVSQPLTPLTINAMAVIRPTYRLSMAVAGEQTMELNYSYNTGKHLAPLIYEGQTFASNLNSAAKEVANIKILIVANVLATNSFGKLTASTEDYDVTQNDGAPPSVSIEAPVASTMSVNTRPALTTLVFDTIKLSGEPTVNDVYAQKRIRFSNNSGFPIKDFRIVYRALVDSTAVKTLPNSFKQVAASSTCSLGMTLNDGASCYITVRYQPGLSDTTDDFFMTAVYQMRDSEYVMNNIGISLFPRSPGQLRANNIIAESINYKRTPTSSAATRSSYPLNFGDQEFNTIPKILSFSDVTGTFAKLQFVNTQATKASLLLSYQKYLAENSLRGYSPLLPAPTSVIPAPGEYRNVGGHDYAKIGLLKYDDNSERMVAEGSKGCFFGDDENDASVPAFRKGFSMSSTTPCYIIITLTANFDYLNKKVEIGNGDDMRENAFEFWYFSVNRSSTASTWVHVKGNMVPNTSTGISGTYANVNAYDNKTASFNLPLVAPGNSNLGNIVGLRVLMSTSTGTLNSPYSTAITTYVDIKPYDPNNPALATFISGLANSNYHYFKVVAIRKDARFRFSSRFKSLGANEYLSRITNFETPLKLLVPPVNHYYFHAQKVIVEKTLTGGVQYEAYKSSNPEISTALTRCKRPALILKNPSSVSVNYQLINLATWNLLKVTPAATSYPNMLETPHWLSDAYVNITTMCSALPSYINNVAQQDLTASKVFYIRNSTNKNALVPRVVGGVPTTNYSNYTSYIDENITFASSRCMAPIP